MLPWRQYWDYETALYQLIKSRIHTNYMLTARQHFLKQYGNFPFRRIHNWLELRPPRNYKQLIGYVTCGMIFRGGGIKTEHDDIIKWKQFPRYFVRDIHWSPVNSRFATWLSNHLPCQLWDENTYPFPNFNDCIVEVWEWISYFLQHFIMNASTYPCWH